MDMKEIREKARKMMGGCKVCPVCNGKACAGQVPGMGGSGTGGSFVAAVEALSRIKLNMRVIHDAAEPDTRAKVLGQELSLPVFAAPVAGVSMNMGCEDISEDDYIRDYLAGCVDGGIIGGFGDAVPDFFFEAGLAALKEVGGKAIPTLKPFEDEYLMPKLDQSAQAGAEVVAMDIDAAGFIIPRMMGRPVLPKTTADLARIVEYTPLKMVLKGVMTPDDAKRAVDAGAAGIVVSNHGGRIIDHLPGTADVLPAIAEAVKGQITILVDGGIRSGADVVKMLALGADAAMIGRPFSWATLGGGREGVQLYLKQLREEFFIAMIVTGCQSVSDINESVLFNRPGR